MSAATGRRGVSAGPGEEQDQARQQPGRGLSRAVVWTGIALGTALAIWAISNGALVRIGGMPAWLGVFLGAIIVWALIVMASVTLAELTRRHHKTARQYAIRQGKRGALAAGRAVRQHGRALIARATAWAGPRWHARQSAKPHDPDSTTADPGLEAPVSGPPAPDPHQPSPSTEGTPMAPNLTGLHSGPRFREHTFAECSPDLCGEKPGALASKYASRITPDRRARRTAAHTGGSVPSEWGPVVAQAADFEPESDGHLLDWMAGQVTGMAAYAEALIEAYETGVGAVGIDPKGLAALHDVADAAAHAAQTMSGARTKFADHYELPREFAANGGLMTHDGRWVTGEGG